MLIRNGKFNIVTIVKSRPAMAKYDPIDFREVRTVLNAFTEALKSGAGYLIRSAREHWLLFLFLMALVFGTGYLLRPSTTPVYESQMVCAFNNMHKKTFGEMVFRLNSLAETRSYQQLSHLLGLSMTQAKTIRGFDARNIAGSPLHEDITPDKLPLYFSLRATDRSVFPAVQEGLLRYLNSSPYHVVRSQAEQEQIRQKIDYLDGSIRKLDQVIDAYTAFLMGTQSVTDTAAGFSNIAALFSYQEQLENKKLEEMKMANLHQSVELVYGFTPTDQPLPQENKYWMKLLGAALLIGFSGTAARKIVRHAS